MTLRLISKWPGVRVLAWDGDYLYASRGYRLYKMRVSELSKLCRDTGRSETDAQRLTIEEGKKRRNAEGGRSGWEEVGFFRPGLLRGKTVNNRFTARLLRTGFHSLAFLPNGRIVAVLAKTIAVLDPGSREFVTRWRVLRGTRPMGIAVTPEGNLFWGEYFDNPSREEVYIYGSFDGGDTWEVVFTFPQGSIRHVHNVLYDPWEKCLWVLTGDEGKEPRIMRVDKDWKTTHIVLEGNQQVRAVTMIFEKDIIYYATDTPHEQNNIYRLYRRTGEVEQVAIITGPSMWSCKAGDIKFFSTAAEPGKSYYPAACIWGSMDGDTWHRLVEWTKDSCHPEYFQFGNAVLPKGKIKENILAATGMAVKNMDAMLNLWIIQKR